MKTLIAYLVLLTAAGSCGETADDEAYQYAYTLAQGYDWSAPYARVYAEAITHYAIVHWLDPYVVARLIRRESDFRWWLVSKKQAYGPMQVRPKWWGHLLYSTSDKDLRRVLVGKKEPWKYLCRIPYGIEAGCRVLAYYRDQYDSYELALVAYCYGPGSAEFKRARNDIGYARSLGYVREILQLGG